MELKSRGFTLTEIVVTVVIVTIIYVVVRVTETTLSDLACSDGQFAVYSANENNWVCRDQAGGGPAFVLLDANGNEVGSVVGLYNAGMHARDVLDKVLVAITLPDSTSTPRTVLQTVTHSQFNREYRNTEFTPAGTNTPFEDKRVLFDAPDCSGNAFLIEKYVANTGFPPLYTSSLTLGAAGEQVRPLYIATGTAIESAQIVSVHQLWGCENVTMTRNDLIRAELLHPNLASIFPPPFTLQPR